MTGVEVSENVSRRLLAGLVVGAVGPLTGWLVADLSVHLVLDATLDARDPLEAGVYGMAGAMLVAIGLAAIATLAAFVLTGAGARGTAIGWCGSVVVFPLWVEVVDRFRIDSLPVYLAVLGLLPGVVRALLPTRPRTSAGLSPAPSDR